ncbi:MAG: redoxin domain-containing protein [Bacteroidales bacterium]|nr:redoxin domain-containing protein [Bacteroidales bacterium]
MMNFFKIFFGLALIFFFKASYGQTDSSLTLSYRLIHSSDSFAVLLSHSGEMTRRIDTAFRQDNDLFVFQSIERFPTGSYTVYFNDSTYTEIILNNENVALEAHSDNILPTMKVLESVENQLLFNYWKYAFIIQDTISHYVYKMNQLQKFDDYEQRSDYLMYEKKVKILNDFLFNTVRKMMTEYPNAFSPKVLLAYQLPDYDRFKREMEAVTVNYEDDLAFLRDHYFDYLDFADSRFLNTKVLHSMISDYIKIFANPANTANYKAIIDFVLAKAKVNEKVYNYCINLFVREFDNTIWEEVFIYAVENYYRSSSLRNSSMSRYYYDKVEFVRKLKPGHPAPEFSIPDSNGTLYTLKSIKGKAKVLIFYSGDCPHCEQAMPGLIELYNQYKISDVAFVGIALDDELNVWKESLQKQNIPWLSLSDLKGLISPAAEAYNIWMTPTIYILDENNVIRGKPNTDAEIHASLLQIIY